MSAAATTPAAVDRPALVGRGALVALRQAAILARRSIVGTVRQPPLWLPSLFFPLLIAGVNNAALDRATALPGFPAESYLDFVLPATIVQAVLLGAIVGGADVALDIEDGFFERLVASPVARSSILLGRLAGAATIGAAQALLITTLFWLVGVEIAGGLAAVAVLVITALVLGVAIGALAAAIGLRTGLQEAVNNSFPLIFILLFISSAFFPTDLMEGWYQTAAEYNPLSWIIDGMRDQILVGFDVGEALTAIGVSAALALLFVLAAVHQLRRRLAVAA